MEDQNGKEIIIGGETVSAKDDYLKTITNLFYKINAAADGKNLSDLQWTLNYYTDILISAILNREARESMKKAKDDIYAAEIIKRQSQKEKGKTLNDEEERQARVAACTAIVGECREYFDKYFGFETKLAVMV